jgi:hypothetical protein
MWDRSLNNDSSVYGDGKASDKILDILLSGDAKIRRSNQIECCQFI